jgi:hypothetical protein
LGAAAGAVVSWRLLKEKYEQIAQEEIDSVKEVFSQKNVKPVEESEETESVNTDDAEEGNEDDIDGYTRIVNDLGYTRYSDISKKDSRKKEHSEGPYIIAEEEFDEIDGYESNTFTYYSDGVLADDNDDVVEDVEDTVGHNSLIHLGQEDGPLHFIDSVYVRNDERKCDYEILYDVRRYSDVFNAKSEE